MFLLEESFHINTMRCMKISSIMRLAAAAAAVLAASALPAETIRLAGSDIIAEKISEAVKKNAETLRLDVDISMIGSRAALEAMKGGSADIAIVAIPEGQPLPENHTLVPYAHQIAAILVNPQNPVEAISIPQLRRIFGNQGERADSWSQLGFTNAASLRNIMPVSTGLKDNIAVELFKSKCLNNSNLSESVEIKADSAAAARVVAEAGNAIAISTSAVPGTKPLAVSNPTAGVAAEAFKPTPENVQNGDYPLTMHFYLMYRPDSVKKIRPLLQMLLSDSMSDLIEKGGLMPAPKNFRKSYSLELDISK